MFKKFIACLEPFKGLFESPPFCPRVEMLLGVGFEGVSNLFVVVVSVAVVYNNQCQ